MSKTHQHGRLLLGMVDPDARFVDEFHGFIKSPPRKPDQQDFHAWCLARIKDLYGATSFEAAFKNENFRTLLAFGYMGYARHPELSHPRVTQAIPVPKVASELEPDFFPVLSKEVRSHAALSASFADDLKAAEQRVSNLVTRLSAKATSEPRAANDGVGGQVISLVTFVGFLVWATLSLEKKKST